MWIRRHPYLHPLAFALLAAVLGGCGSNVETSGGPCATLAPARPIDSDEALALWRCNPTLPPSAVLLRLRSGTNADLTAQGRAAYWEGFFWDEPTQTSFSGYFHAATGASIGAVAGGDNPCGTSGLQMVSSKKLAPDAMARFPPHDPLLGGTTGYFMQEFCGAKPSEWPRMVIVQRTNADTPLYFTVRYDEQGAYKDVCGPCGLSWAECASCSP
jgi:hypothetical protein